MSKCPHCHQVIDCKGLAGVVECPCCKKRFRISPAQTTPLVTAQLPEPASTLPEEFHFTLDSPGSLSRQSLNRRKKPKPWWDFFDLGFHHYLTPIIIKVIWALCLGLAVLTLASAGFFAIGSMIPESKAQSRTSNSQYDSPPTFRPPTHPSALEEAGSLLLYRVLGWIGLAIVIAITLLVVRVVCESIIVLFNIAESLASIDKKPAKA
jgi:hypothetical protein